MPIPFNPQDKDFIQNPYPTYERLQAESPIFWHEDMGMWVVASYVDVMGILRDKRFGRSIDHVISPEARGATPPSTEYAPFYKLSDNSMFDKEPPEHTRLKSLVHKAFTPRRVENLRASIQQITNDLLDRVDGEMDLLDDFAVPLPVTVIGELLGVPEADRRYLRPWSADIVAMYELNHTPEQAQRAVQASIEFSDYLRNLAKERRKHPQDDLITALAQAEEDGDKLTEDELISTCVLLLNAGHEATVNVIGNGMRALFQYPDQLDLLRHNPMLIQTAIEELMRFDTPLQLFRRWILEDMDYKGHAFQQGKEVALLFASANRDSAQFEHPQQLDLTRQDNPHVTFGAGIHYCLGAPLARLELQIAFQTLLTRFPKLEPIEEPVFRDAFVIRGLQDFRLLIH